MPSGQIARREQWLTIVTETVWVFNTKKDKIMIL